MPRADDDWTCDTNEMGAVIYPKSTGNYNNIVDKLKIREKKLNDESHGYKVIRSKHDESFVAFIHIENLGDKGFAILKALEADVSADPDPTVGFKLLDTM